MHFLKKLYLDWKDPSLQLKAKVENAHFPVIQYLLLFSPCSESLKVSLRPWAQWQTGKRNAAHFGPFQLQEQKLLLLMFVAVLLLSEMTNERPPCVGHREKCNQLTLNGWSLCIHLKFKGTKATVRHSSWQNSSSNSGTLNSHWYLNQWPARSQHRAATPHGGDSCPVTPLLVAEAVAELGELPDTSSASFHFLWTFQYIVW